MKIARLLFAVGALMVLSGGIAPAHGPSMPPDPWDPCCTCGNPCRPPPRCSTCPWWDIGCKGACEPKEKR